MPQCTGFIEELGQDAAAPAPPHPEAPFPTNDQFDQLGQVCGPFKSTKKYKQYQTGAWTT